mmetsp:Transcript_7008/g.25848  ORF Transcript_7008/g.25848 Transcript_7008/m.25848 type:complete len:818 (-) Transcript_7008:193-2646(-)
METQLRALVQESMGLYLYHNAIFLGERLVAAFPSEGNALLLASCYMRNDQPHRCHHILKGSVSPQARYMFATCCMKLGRLAEAEAALLGKGVEDTQTTDGAAKDAVPNGAAGYFLLGMICKRTDRRTAAVKHFCTALNLDPFLWSAFEELCVLGADEEAGAFLQEAGNLSSAHVPDTGLHHPANGTAAAASSAQPRSASAVHNLFSSFSTPNENANANQGQRSNNVAVSQDLSAMLTPSTVSPALRGAPSTLPPQSTQLLPAELRASVGDATLAPPMYGSQGQQPVQVTPSAFTTPSPTAAGMGLGGAQRVPTSSDQKGAPRVLGAPQKAPAPPPAMLGQGRQGGRGTQGDMDVDDSGLTPHSGFLRTDHVGDVSGANRHKFVDEGKLRKISSRLRFNDSALIDPHVSRLSGAGVPGVSGGNLGTPRLGGSKADPVTNRYEGTQTDRITVVPTRSIFGGKEELLAAESGGHKSYDGDKEGALAVLSLLAQIGRGLRLLSKFCCAEACEALRQLPIEQFQTAYILCLMGRCHFEMVEYVEAERYFQWSRRVSPDRLEGLELYSTVLWHLRKDVELSYLAQEAISLDRLSPQAWCVMGNCFSLQREHDAALRFFQRALQLCPTFTYAHTLCGHEHFVSEDVEKGLDSFRNAIRIDERHYNAWYGLGTIYLRQEQYDMAHYHFKKAKDINPRSSVLFCCLGMASHKLKRNNEALQLLETAITMDSKNPLAKFEKASVLMSMELYHEAIQELEALKDQAPREASVYFQMGKIYKKLDQVDRAMVNFSIALDLKPSSADINQIKSAIEKLNVPEDSEDEDLA